MIITSFVYCDRVETQPAPAPKNQIHRLVDPLQMLAPFSIPGAFSFSISLGFQGREIVEKSMQLRLDFLDPDDNALFSTGEIPFPKMPEDNIPPENHGLNLNLDIRNLVFSQPGYHKTKVYIDNNCMNEFPILVTVAKN